MKNRTTKLPYITWKYFPKWLCRLANRVFGRPVLGRRKLKAQWTVETEDDLRKVHGMDVQKEVREMLTKELEYSLK